NASGQPISLNSAQFNINPPLNLQFQGQTVKPQLKFLAAPNPSVPSGQKFAYQLQVFDANNVPNLPANFFSTIAPAHVTIILRDGNGNPLPTGPFLVGDGLSNIVGNNGMITFNESITVTATTTFQLYAILDLGGVFLTSVSTPLAP